MAGRFEVRTVVDRSMEEVFATDGPKSS